MARKKTHEEFVKQVFELVGDEYEFLEKYTNYHKAINTRHVKCNYIWKSSPKHLLSRAKSGKIYCPNCNGGVKKHDTEGFKKIINNLIKDEYIVIDEYINALTPIKMQHLSEECMHIFYVSPANFIHKNSRCPKCSGHYKDTKRFKEQVYNDEGANYLVLGEYVDGYTSIKMQHCENECYYIFEVIPKNFLWGSKIRCPKCNPPSKGEIKITDFFIKNDISFERQFTFDDCKHHRKLKFDFAIIKDNEKLIMIEYDGEGHFIPIDFAGKGDNWAEEQFQLNQKRDRIKNKYCNDNNIPLFRIPYWYFNDIEKILDKIIHNKPLEVDETSFLVSV